MHSSIILIHFYLFFGFFTSIIGCSNKNLPKYVALDKLRVLAILSNNPEVNPSQASDFPLVIKPIVSDISETTQLSYSLEGCLDPGVSLGASASCDNSSTQINISSGAITSLSSASRFTGLANSISINQAQIPTADVAFANQSTQSQNNGVSYLLIYRLRNSRNEEVKAIKRIILSTKSTKNQNPILTDILAEDGSSWQVQGSSEQTISPLYSVANESYSELTSSGETKSLSESLTTTWFYTDGEVEKFRTSDSQSNVYTAPDITNLGHDAFLILIGRDNRGGASAYLKCLGTCTGITSGPIN